MELSKLEKFYRTQSRFYDFTRSFFLFNRKKAVEFLELQPSDKVIDLACGTGLNMPLLISKVPPANIIGIDYSESMLKLARKKYPGVRFIQGDAASYKFPAPVDKIISTYSFSMIDDWQNTIMNIKPAIKENGKIVILDFHPWHGIMKPFYPFFRWWLLKHGVNPEKQLASFLRKYFIQVEEFVFHSGYDTIIVARKE